MKKVKVTHNMVSAHIDNVYRKLDQIPGIAPKSSYPTEMLQKMVKKYAEQLKELEDYSTLVVTRDKLVMSKVEAIRKRTPFVIIYTGFKVDKYLEPVGKNKDTVSILGKTAVKELAYAEIQHNLKSVNLTPKEINPGYVYVLTDSGEDFALVTYKGLLEFIESSGLSTIGCTESDVYAFMGDTIQEKIKLAVPPKKDIFKFSSSCYDLETLLDKYIIAKGNDVYTAEDIENEMIPEDLEAFKSQNPKEYEACVIGDVEPLARVIAVNVGEGKGRYIFVEDANKYIEMFGSPAVSWIMSK